MTARKAVGPEQRRMPRHRRAPVMPDDHRLLGAQRCGETHRVADQMEDRVLVDRLRLVGQPIAAHVGRDGVVAGFG